MKTTPWRKDALIYMPKKVKKNGDGGSLKNVGYVQGAQYFQNLSANGILKLHTIRLEQDFRWGQVEYNQSMTIDGVKISSVPYWTTPQERKEINVCVIDSTGESTFNSSNMKRSNGFCHGPAVITPNVYSNCWVFDTTNKIAYDVKVNAPGMPDAIYAISPQFRSYMLRTSDLNSVLSDIYGSSFTTFVALENVYVTIYEPTQLDALESYGVGNFARSLNTSVIMFTGGGFTHGGFGLTDEEISDIAWCLGGISTGNKIDFTIQQHTI